MSQISVGTVAKRQFLRNTDSRGIYWLLQCVAPSAQMTILRLSLGDYVARPRLIAVTEQLSVRLIAAPRAMFNCDAATPRVVRDSIAILCGIAFIVFAKRRLSCSLPRRQ